MYNTSVPPRSELPTTGQLIRSTLAAIAIAAVLLVTIVLPAEYAIDPTGIGRMLGLTQMGEIKKEASEAEHAAAPAVEAPVAKSSGAAQTNEITLVLAPNEGTEVKVDMVKDASLKYRWEVSGGVVNYDMHGEPYADLNAVHSYAQNKGIGRDEGSLVAAFDGRHGWYWRNRGSAPVTVTLTTTGKYQNFKRVL